jgi:CRP-like cAMP-binding protein
MQDLVSKALDLSREFADQKVNLKTIKLTQASNYNPQVVSVAYLQAFFNMVKKPTNQKTTEDVMEILGVMVHEFVSVAESLPGLDVEEMILYALSLHAKSLMPYDILCRIGEPPIEVYYVLSGNIGVTNLNNKVLTKELIEGKIFHTEVRGATLGEASILFNSNRYA